MTFFLFRRLWVQCSAFFRTHLRETECALIIIHYCILLIENIDFRVCTYIYFHIYVYIHTYIFSFSSFLYFREWMFHRHFVSKQWQNLRMINLAYMENARAIRMKVSVIAEFIIEAFKVTSKYRSRTIIFIFISVRVRFANLLFLYNARSHNYIDNTYYN